MAFTNANAQYETVESMLQNYIPNYSIVDDYQIAAYENAFYTKPVIEPEALKADLKAIIKEFPAMAATVKNGTGTINTFTRHNYKIQTPYVDYKVHGLRVITDNNNGYLVMEIPYVNGVIQGVLKAYTRNGILLSETTYKNGIKHGMKTAYGSRNERESFTVTGQYINGDLANQLTIQYEGLKLLYPSDFKKGTVEAYDGSFLWLTYSIAGNGVKHGVFQTFNILYDTKKSYCSLMAHYHMGKLNGTVKKYDQSASLKEKNVFMNGNPIDTFWGYDRNGTLMFTALFDKQGHRNGLTSVYASSGKIYQTTAYKNNLKNGFEILFSNGIKSSIKYYQDGLMEGNGYHFRENGDTSTITVYQNNKVIKETTFFKSGHIKSVFIPYQSHTYYDKEGNKVWTNHYDDEKIIGVYKSINYDINENIIIYSQTKYTENGVRYEQTTYLMDGSIDVVPWKGNEYAQGIGKKVSKDGKEEIIYYNKGKKVSKAEYENAIDSQHK